MTVAQTAPDKSNEESGVKVLEGVVVRFAGDSGDGMQLAGTQFTNASAIFGNDVSTLPDFPAEIRAPAGTLAGVSGFQINFSSHDVHTPGDIVSTLVAMNPAALRANIDDVEKGGILVVNQDEFTKNNLKKAGYETNPLENDNLNGYRLYKVPMTRLNEAAIKDLGLDRRSIGRSKNLFALGLVYWLYSRPCEPTERWIQEKFARRPAVAEANLRALRAGFAYGETTEIFAEHYRVPKAKTEPGNYRKINGNDATALGLIAAAHLAGKKLFLASYPITPASEILHELSRHKGFGVRTFQAEDEICAMGAVIGAAFAGSFAVTSTSGPGLALKSEAIGLAVVAELPMVIVNVQRGGPSTGLPTKTEQSDLLQALYGRNGDCPIPVVAPATPSECFDMAVEAFRIAVRYMTPVIMLTDGYLANGSEPWLVPQLDSLPKIEVHHPTSFDGDKFLPFARNENLARPWAIPGTPGLEHRVGGIERQDGTGDVCYDPDNHHRMSELRTDKIAGIADYIPDLKVDGPQTADLVIVGWGSTYGAITTAVQTAQNKGLSVSHIHLRYLNPFPKNLKDLLGHFKQVLVPEMNMGQLPRLIRDRCLVDARGFNRVYGKPFAVHDIESAIEKTLRGGNKQ